MVEPPPPAEEFCEPGEPCSRCRKASENLRMFGLGFFLFTVLLAGLVWGGVHLAFGWGVPLVAAIGFAAAIFGAGFLLHIRIGRPHRH